SYLIADPVRVERVGASAPGPEIQVVANGVSVADGTGIVDFGETTPGVPVSPRIPVRTPGTANSTLGTPYLALGTITVPSGFTIISGFGSTTVGPGQSTSFVVRLDATTEGVV